MRCTLRFLLGVVCALAVCRLAPADEPTKPTPLQRDILRHVDELPVERHVVLGDGVVPALRQALADDPPLDLRRRLPSWPLYFGCLLPDLIDKPLYYGLIALHRLPAPESERVDTRHRGDVGRRGAALDRHRHLAGPAGVHP